MGVKGLKTFVSTTVPDGKESVDICQEIRKWTIQHNKREPSILIDLKEFSHLIVQRDEVGIFIGGRHKLYYRLYSNFFRALQEQQVNLIFFASCNKLTDSMEIFIPKREEEYLKFIEHLDNIDTRQPIREILRKKNGKVPDKRSTLAVEYNILRICRKYGELNFNYFRHNQQIAQYAQTHASDVMAIITNDTDFLIFPGDFQYWSCNDINMKELTTVRLCRQALWTHLDLTEHQLYMMAALSGNYYLPYDIVKRFHLKLNQSEEKFSKFPVLADYVRQLTIFPTADAKKHKFDLKKIGEDIFGSEASEEEINTIENGLAVYNLDFCVRSDEKDFLKQAKRTHSFIYKLLMDDIFRIRDIAFIDYRDYRSKTYAELVIPLISKLLGILHKNDVNQPVTRAICMKYEHEEPFKVVDEWITYPAMNVPELYELIFKDRNHRLDRHRWELLQWILCLDDSQMRAIRSLPEKYTSVLLTILYLLQQGEITEIEADAFLITEHDLREPGLVPKNIRYPDCLDGRYVRIAHLYTKMYELICKCLQVCGFSKYADLILFDGAHFHNYLESFETSPDMHETITKTIKKLRIY